MMRSSPDTIGHTSFRPFQSSMKNSRLKRYFFAGGGALFAGAFAPK